MKLTFKTITGKSFNVEAEESLTIGELKDKVAEVQPDCPREAMKLVYKGKVLEDATTVAANQVTEATFIVVFVQPKKAEAPKPAAAAPPAVRDRGSTPSPRAARHLAGCPVARLTLCTVPQYHKGRTNRQ